MCEEVAHNGQGLSLRVHEGRSGSDLGTDFLGEPLDFKPQARPLQNGWNEGSWLIGWW